MRFVLFNLGYFWQAWLLQVLKDGGHAAWCRVSTACPRLWKMQLPASDHSWRIPSTMPLTGTAWVLQKVHEASWLD